MASGRTLPARSLAEQSYQLRRQRNGKQGRDTASARFPEFTQQGALKDHGSGRRKRLEMSEKGPSL